VKPVLELTWTVAKLMLVLLAAPLLLFLDAG
jgi:hypothetical protein